VVLLKDCLFVQVYSTPNLHPKIGGEVGSGLIGIQVEEFVCSLEAFLIERWSSFGDELRGNALFAQREG